MLDETHYQTITLNGLADGRAVTQNEHHDTLPAMRLTLNGSGGRAVGRIQIPQCLNLSILQLFNEIVESMKSSISEDTPFLFSLLGIETELGKLKK